MKKIKYFTAIILAVALFSSCKKTSCDYIECNATCKNFENFETYAIGTFGNWQQVSLTSMAVVNKGGTKKFYLEDGSGGSNAFNTTDFPKDLTQAGCELSYDVEYLSGANNGSTAANSIGIYQGVFPTLTFTRRALFRLKAPNLILDASPTKTIKVPLALASGTTLPSNAYGDWVLVGGAAVPTAADIANFNALIQNIGGLYIPVDNGANPVEKWWYDNFCFTQCCP
jgi:hypothetical protein